MFSKSKQFLIILISTLCFTVAMSQSSAPVLMALSAHPDDEDGAALAYYAKLKGVKTYSVFYTRGEGGQNETGSELGDDLGLLRTKETLEAANLLGSEVIFLGFPDFGFSKTAKETFLMWQGYDTVLARLVYVIRLLKPDVIITNHDTITSKPNRQHGNHQAVGITAYDAFQKATDPAYHPEQFNEHVQPWQVKKLYFRFFNRGNVSRDSLVMIDATARLEGNESVEKLALNALAEHRSQGMDKLTLDSIPSFFRQHAYALFRADRKYSFDKADLFSDILPEKREPVTAGNIHFRQVNIPQAEARDSKSVKAVWSENILLGIVATYDSTIKQTLGAFGIPNEKLDSSMLAEGNLARYSTILLDMRTYEHRPDAVKNNERLLDYANGGGNIVCFYHKTGDWNGKNLSPHTITLSGERVTEETAPVKILNTNHPLFNNPNRITENDWDGWAQERSIYLPSDDTTKTSSRYERLLAMSDTDELQPSTSLLSTQYGKGTYTYVSLALYRQLRNCNEGAEKLFFNLISQSRGE